MLSSRPVRPLVPTSVDVPSSSDTKNCDRPAGGAEERNEKRDAAAARWKKLFATQSPARAEDGHPGRGNCLHLAVEDGHPGRGNASHVNILLSKI